MRPLSSQHFEQVAACPYRPHFKMCLSRYPLRTSLLQCATLTLKHYGVAKASSLFTRTVPGRQSYIKKFDYFTDCSGTLANQDRLAHINPWIFKKRNKIVSGMQRGSLPHQKEKKKKNFRGWQRLASRHMTRDTQKPQIDWGENILTSLQQFPWFF